MVNARISEGTLQGHQFHAEALAHLERVNDQVRVVLGNFGG
jgi:hypothetical protein